MSIFSRSGARGLQRLLSLNRFTLGLNAAKNAHQYQKASNKICSELNSVQKSLRVHTSISPISGARGLQRLHFLELLYYNVLEWESRFTFGMDAAENTNYIKKFFKLKLFKIKFSIKNSLNACLYLTQEWS